MNPDNPDNPGNVGHPTYALWAVPRSCSTAFERMVMERGDLKVLHEPFSASYYFGPEPGNRRYEAQGLNPANPFGAVWGQVRAAASAGPVFFKDMAYHAVREADWSVLGRLRSTFLIRDPAASLLSMARKMPDFTEEEAGFTAVERLFDLVSERTGEVPPLIDSADLGADPVGVVAAWCRAVGLEPRPEALEWQPGMRPEWGVWAPWHQEAARSRGFRPLPEQPAADVDGLLEPHAAVLARANLIYQRLRAHRLRPIE